MRCSVCSNTIPDGTAICPHCDAILDDSFLSAPPERGGAEDTPALRRSPDGVADDLASTEPADLPRGESPHPADQLGELWRTFTRLPFEEKVSSASAVLLFVGSFLPWRETLGDSQLGLATWGLATILLAVLAGVAAPRRHTARTGPQRLAWTLALLSSGGLSFLASVHFAFTTRETAIVGGRSIEVVWPAAGPYLAALGGAGVVLGAILALRREGAARR